MIQPDKSVYEVGGLSPPHIASKTMIEHFAVVNEEGKRMEGTLYRPGKAGREGLGKGSLDVVVYLHTRGGSRMEGLFLVPLLTTKLGVVLFDFAGSGHSEGEFITLGPKEARDTAVIIDYVREKCGVNQVILWGRSMGAVAAILFASENNHRISGLILDSPFSCFRRMIYDIVYSRNRVPTCLIDFVMHFLVKTVRNKTGVCMYSIKPIKSVPKVTTPCFYMVSHEDLISRPDKVKDLYLLTGAVQKEFYLTQGEHNSTRNKESIFKAMCFSLRCLGSRPSMLGTPNVSQLSLDQSSVDEHKTRQERDGSRDDLRPLLGVKGDDGSENGGGEKGLAQLGMDETNKLD